VRKLRIAGVGETLLRTMVIGMAARFGSGLGRTTGTVAWIVISWPVGAALL
jgi:hypothetical protein